MFQYFPYLPEVKSICSTKNADFPIFSIAFRMFSRPGNTL